MNLLLLIIIIITIIIIKILFFSIKNIKFTGFYLFCFFFSKNLKTLLINKN